jgi:hypothetical protein
LEFQIKKRSDRPVYIHPEYTQVSEDVVIASTLLPDGPGKRRERHQVVTFRDGHIVDMQGFTSGRQAERFARNQSVR